MTPMLPSERVAGFVAHLRRSGYRIGPAEAEATFGFLAGGAVAIAARLGMKALLTGSREQWEGFDELFDAYWHGRGLHRVVPAKDASTDLREMKPPPVWDRVLPSQQDRSTDVPQAQLTEGDAPTSQRDGAGRLIASRRGQWNQLLAATFTTVALAIPVLIVAATIEVYVWPHILEAISPLHDFHHITIGVSGP